jgi:hypothetical protein
MGGAGFHTVVLVSYSPLCTFPGFVQMKFLKTIESRSSYVLYLLMVTHVT